MKEIPISILLHKKQIVNDVSAACNVIGRTLQKSDDTAEQGAEIMSPDDEATKPIVARSLSEGFAEVKRVCKRYLVTGRESDDNRLEKIDERKESTTEIISAAITSGTASSTVLKKEFCTITVKSDGEVEVKAGNKTLGTVNGSASYEYTATGDAETLTLTSKETASVECTVTYTYGSFGSFYLELGMPSSFNLGVTETIKSTCHRIIVDYTVRALMMDQYPDKAATYGERLKEDESNLRSALLSRTSFNRRVPDWS